MRFKVSQAERELLSGIASVVDVGPDNEVELRFPVYVSFPELMELLEAAILRQESDQGDWLRAQEYRKAKPGLHDKIRRHFLRPVRD